jgi:hypothetical protein
VTVTVEWLKFLIRVRGFSALAAEMLVTNSSVSAIAMRRNDFIYDILFYRANVRMPAEIPSHRDI